ARRSGLVITPREVFQHQTVEELAAVARPAGEGEDVEAEAPGAGVGRVPATPIMRWYRELRGPVDGYSQRMLLQVPPGLGLDRLTAALQTVLDHHDMLRLRVDGDEFEVAEPGAVDAAALVRRVDVAGLGADALRAVLAEEAEAARRRLDPAAGTMAQLVWFDAGDAASGRLLLTVHHLAVDGVSWRILLPDPVTAWGRGEVDPGPRAAAVGRRARHPRPGPRLPAPRPGGRHVRHGPAPDARPARRRHRPAPHRGPRRLPRPRQRRAADRPGPGRRRVAPRARHR